MDVYDLLYSADLTDDTDRLMLADALEDVGRAGEAAILRDLDAPAARERLSAEIFAPLARLREVPDATWARGCYADWLRAKGREQEAETQEYLIEERPAHADELEEGGSLSDIAIEHAQEEGFGPGESTVMIFVYWHKRLAVYLYRSHGVYLMRHQAMMFGGLDIRIDELLARCGLAAPDPDAGELELVCVHEVRI